MLFENREVGDRLEHRLKQRLMREPGTHQLSRRNDCSGQTEFHVSRTGPSRTFTQLRFGMSACGPSLQMWPHTYLVAIGAIADMPDALTHTRKARMTLLDRLLRVVGAMQHEQRAAIPARLLRRAAGAYIGPGTGMHLQASVLPLPTDMTPCWARFRWTSANACGSSSRPCRS